MKPRCGRWGPRRRARAPGAGQLLDPVQHRARRVAHGEGPSSAQRGRGQKGERDRRQDADPARAGAEQEEAAHDLRGARQEHRVLGPQPADRGDHEDRAQGRAEQVEEVDAAGSKAAVGQEAAQDEAQEREGQREEQGEGQPAEELLEEVPPAGQRLRARFRAVEGHGNDQGGKGESRGADRERILEVPQEQGPHPAQDDAGEGQAEHGERDHEERVIVQELDGDDAVHQDLDEQHDPCGEEGLGRRPVLARRARRWREGRQKRQGRPPFAGCYRSPLPSGPGCRHKPDACAISTLPSCGS